MADKELTLEEIAMKQRDISMAILGSPELRDIFVASHNNLEKISGEKVQKLIDFGEEGKDATYDFKYKASLKRQAQNPDTNAAKVVFGALYNLESNSDRGAARLAPQDLFERFYLTYLGAIDKVKVIDMINLSRYEQYKDLTKNELNMYMKDFAKANPQMYNNIRSTYLSFTLKKGSAEALIASAEDDRRKGEMRLNAEYQKRLAEAQKNAQGNAAA